MRYGLPESRHYFTSFEDKSIKPLHGLPGPREAVKVGELTLEPE